MPPTLSALRTRPRILRSLLAGNHSLKLAAALDLHNHCTFEFNSRRQQYRGRQRLAHLRVDRIVHYPLVLFGCGQAGPQSNPFAAHAMLLKDKAA